jgi:hypothetical protein
VLLDDKAPLLRGRDPPLAAGFGGLRKIPFRLVFLELAGAGHDDLLLLQCRKESWF